MAVCDGLRFPHDPLAGFTRKIRRSFWEAANKFTKKTTHQTDCAGLRRNVGVPNLGDEVHLGRLERVAGRDVDVDHKSPPLERRALSTDKEKKNNNNETKSHRKNTATGSEQTK